MNGYTEGEHQNEKMILHEKFKINSMLAKGFGFPTDGDDESNGERKSEKEDQTGGGGG